MSRQLYPGKRTRTNVEDEDDAHQHEPTTLITVQSTRSKIRAKNRTITFPDVNGLPVTVPESTIIRNGFRKIA